MEEWRAHVREASVSNGATAVSNVTTYARNATVGIRINGIRLRETHH